MAMFEPAIRLVLRHEGGFVNHKKDPGGATNFGISLRYLKARGDLDKDGLLDGDLDGDGDVDIQDIQKMTEAQAIKYYETAFWKPQPYVLLPQSIANKLFDMAVNMGCGQANKLFQRALNSLGFACVVDGQLGPRTQALIRIAVAKFGEPALVACTRSEQAGFYRQLAAAHPELRVFLNGWLSRAAE